MQNMYQPPAKQPWTINGNQEQCSQQQKEIPQEVIQNKNDMEEADDDDNEDEEEEEQEPQEQDDEYDPNNDEESEGTTTAAKSEGSNMFTTQNNNIHSMHSSALDMYIEDAPVLELSSTDKTLFKEVVDSTLFKEVKFYSSWDEVNHIMGYVFHKSYKDGTKFVNHLERAKLWAAGGVITFQPGLVN